MTNERGVTFPELLAATLLIALALAPLMQLYPALLEGDQEAEGAMRVGVAGQRRMEEIITRLRAGQAEASGVGACLLVDPPGCRVEWTVATEQSSGVSGVGTLQTVSVLACLDRDGTAGCNPGDVQVRHDAKVTSRP